MSRRTAGVMLFLSLSCCVPRAILLQPFLAQGFQSEFWSRVACMESSGAHHWFGLSNLGK